jgi:hypothetical protein
MFVIVPFYSSITIIEYCHPGLLRLKVTTETISWSDTLNQRAAIQQELPPLLPVGYDLFMSTPGVRAQIPCRALSQWQQVFTINQVVSVKN